jgi:flavin reductase (DIM6/NTAB) family NADH-FMN oxidoreductase RutF
MAVALEDFYKLLAPRPIVLITTVDKRGRINAAPMSFVTPIEIDPPILALSTGYDGDTYRNISETGEFVVNLVTEKIKKQMRICGRSFPHGVNELEKAGLRWEPSKKVKPPRVIECPVNLECKLEWTYKGPEYVVVAGRVVAVNVRKGAVKAGRLNVEGVRPLLHITGKAFIVGEREVGP